MLGYKVEKMSFCNKADNGQQLQLQNKFSYNVKYASDGKNCFSELDIEVFDKSAPDIFNLKLVLVGVFGITEKDSPREVLHVQTYKELFPYARAIISNITVNAGIPPVILQGMDIEKQSIYRIDKNPPESFKQ